MKKPPCRVDGHDCPDRFPGCHDKCLKYMEYASSREELRKARGEYKRNEDYLMKRSARRHTIWVERNKR